MRDRKGWVSRDCSLKVLISCAFLHLLFYLFILTIQILIISKLQYVFLCFILKQTKKRINFNFASYFLNINITCSFRWIGSRRLSYIKGKIFYVS